MSTNSRLVGDISIVLLVAGIAALVVCGLVLYDRRSWHDYDADPYVCYGSGRYEAMASGEPSCGELPYYTRHRVARESKVDSERKARQEK